MLARWVARADAGVSTETGGKDDASPGTGGDGRILSSEDVLCVGPLDEVVDGTLRPRSWELARPFAWLSPSKFCDSCERLKNP